jgi:hypothetical protein
MTKQMQDKTIEDRVRAALVALEVVDGSWAVKLGEFAEAALAMRDRYGNDDKQFGAAWDAADFKYHSRRIGKTARAGVLKIARRLRDDRDRTIKKIINSRSRSLELIAENLGEGGGAGRHTGARHVSEDSETSTQTPRLQSTSQDRAAAGLGAAKPPIEQPVLLAGLVRSLDAIDAPNSIILTPLVRPSEANIIPVTIPQTEHRGATFTRGADLSALDIPPFRRRANPTSTETPVPTEASPAPDSRTEPFDAHERAQRLQDVTAALRAIKTLSSLERPFTWMWDLIDAAERPAEVKALRDMVIEAIARLNILEHKSESWLKNHLHAEIEQMTGLDK